MTNNSNYNLCEKIIRFKSFLEYNMSFLKTAKYFFHGYSCSKYHLFWIGYYSIYYYIFTQSVYPSFWCPLCTCMYTWMDALTQKGLFFENIIYLSFLKSILFFWVIIIFLLIFFCYFGQGYFPPVSKRRYWV